MFIKNRTLQKIITFIVMLVLFVTPLSQTYAADLTYKKANYVLKDKLNARTELQSIAKEREIQALVYLKDVYNIREESSPYSASVASVATGTLVYITDVEEDGGRNIWFRVKSIESGTQINGYVERDFLAYSDERLLKWEEKYVTTVGREETSATTNTADIEQFPESYKKSLYELKKKHPDWIFVRFNCGLDWNKSIAAESEGALSLIDTNGTPASRMDGLYGAGWAYASDGSIAYYMDPRNWLSEQQIFQHELLTYNPSYHTEDAVKKMLAGTFMAGNIEGTSTAYSSYFMSIAAKYKISPILQASRVISEQGTGGSAMISGTYPGYEGYYNYYNIQAYGATTDAIMLTGLSYAKSKGWSTRMASLDGGASFLSNGYISVGQDTFYLQKWDLVGTPYTHQYMQAIYAAKSDATSAYKGYSKSGVLNTAPFVFRIPVFENMPAANCVNPSSEDKFTINIDKVENLPVDQSAVVLPYINGAKNTGYTYTYSSSNSSVAKVDANGVITGVRPGNAVITCRAANLAPLTVSVQVVKADIAVADVAKPEIDITYNNKTTLASVELPTGFTWVDDTVVPTVENNGYSVLYEPDNSRYNAITMTIPVNVAKGKIEATELAAVPSIEAEAGTELSGIPLPDNYAWADSDAALPAKAGIYKFKASYCLDSENYEPTEDIEITVNAVCKTHKYGDWSEPSNGYMYRVCSICGDKESLEVADQVTAKDCLTDGHEMVDGVCANCGYVEPVIQVHTHNYSISESTFNCTQDGVNLFTCSCGDSYTEEVKASGHKYVAGVCSVCGYKYEPTPQVTPLPATISPTPIVAPTKAVPTSVPTPTPVPTSVPTPTAVPTKAVTPTAVPTKVAPQITPVATPVPTKVAVPTAIPTKAIPTLVPTEVPTKVVAQVTNIVLKPTAAPVVTEQPKVTEAPKVTPAVTEAAKPTEVVSVPTKAVATEAVKPQIKPSAATSDKPVVPEVTKVVEESDSKVTPEAEVDVAADDVLESLSEEATTDTPAKVQKAVVYKLEDAAHIDIADIADNIADATNLVVELGDTGITWDIDLSNVEDASMLDIDLSVKIGESTIPGGVINNLETEDYVLVSLGHDGPFGFDVKLNVPVGAEHNGKYANLYYFNPETNELELIDSVFVVDGSAGFNMKHASEYAITFTDKQLTIVNNTARTMTILIIVLLAVISVAMTGVIIYRRRMMEPQFYDDEMDDIFVHKSKDDGIDYFD